MLVAPEKLVASPGLMVTLTARKWSGVATTVGSLAAATGVRVIAGGAGMVCAAAGAARAAMPNNMTPIVLRCIIVSYGKLIRPSRCAESRQPAVYHDCRP